MLSIYCYLQFHHPQQTQSPLFFSENSQQSTHTSGVDQRLIPMGAAGHSSDNTCSKAHRVSLVKPINKPCATSALQF